jgi:hypothetical protein
VCSGGYALAAGEERCGTCGQQNLKKSRGTPSFSDSFPDSFSDKHKFVPGSVPVDLEQSIDQLDAKWRRAVETIRGVTPAVLGMVANKLFVPLAHFLPSESDEEGRKQDVFKAQYQAMTTKYFTNVTGIETKKSSMTTTTVPVARPITTPSEVTQAATSFFTVRAHFYGEGARGLDGKAMSILNAILYGKLASLVDVPSLVKLLDDRASEFASSGCYSLFDDTEAPYGFSEQTKLMLLFRVPPPSHVPSARFFAPGPASPPPGSRTCQLTIGRQSTACPCGLQPVSHKTVLDACMTGPGRPAVCMRWAVGGDAFCGKTCASHKVGVLDLLHACPFCRRTDHTGVACTTLRPALLRL